MNFARKVWTSLLVDIEDIGAETPVAVFHLLAEHGGLHDQIDGDMVFEDPDVLLLAGLFVERPFDLPAGQILGMEDPSHRMAPLPAEIELLGIGGRAGEFNPPLDQFADPLGTLRDDETDHLFVAEPASADQRIVDVIFKTVRLILNDGNPSLSHIGIRVGLVLLGDHGDGSQLGRLDGKAESRDAGAQNEKISMYFQSCLFSEKFVCKNRALLYIFPVIL